MIFFVVSESKKRVESEKSFRSLQNLWFVDINGYYNYMAKKKMQPTLISLYSFEKHKRLYILFLPLFFGFYFLW